MACWDLVPAGRAAARPPTKVGCQGNMHVLAAGRRGSKRARAHTHHHLVREAAGQQQPAALLDAAGQQVQGIGAAHRAHDDGLRGGAGRGVAGRGGAGRGGAGWGGAGRGGAAVQAGRVGRAVKGRGHAGILTAGGSSTHLLNLWGQVHEGAAAGLLHGLLSKQFVPGACAARGCVGCLRVGVARRTRADPGAPTLGRAPICRRCTTARSVVLVLLAAPGAALGLLLLRRSLLHILIIA
jgi:hypothetical protein